MAERRAESRKGGRVREGGRVGGEGGREGGGGERERDGRREESKEYLTLLRFLQHLELF
mgnify:CR=1 FL=1